MRSSPTISAFLEQVTSEVARVLSQIPALLPNEEHVPERIIFYSPRTSSAIKFLAFFLFESAARTQRTTEQVVRLRELLRPHLYDEWRRPLPGVLQSDSQRIRTGENPQAS